MPQDDPLGNLAREFKAALDAGQAGAAKSECRLPNREAVRQICQGYLDVLFPVFYRARGAGAAPGGSRARRYLARVKSLLQEQIGCAIRFDARRKGLAVPAGVADRARQEVHEIFRQLPELSGLMASDIEAGFENDPAAGNREDLLLSYPYIQAMTVQRLAHRLYRRGVPFVPRMMTETAHGRTGIDIHPGASIGESFFIDHGTGVVIGETATIGRKVTLYHGVTLGAFNPLVKNDQGQLRRGGKRHPDLEDHVTVYPGATILGGKTRIGHHSVIGGNVWLTHSVAPYSRVTIQEPGLVILERDGGPGIGEGI